MEKRIEKIRRKRIVDWIKNQKNGEMHMGKKWFLVSFNPHFSRSVGTFLDKQKMKQTRLRDQTYLIYSTPKIWKKNEIRPFLISAQEMKKCANEKNMMKFIQKNSEKEKTYALRAWSLNDSKLSGRDLEVKMGIALEKKGVEMNPSQKNNIWFILKHEKSFFISACPLSLDAHLFPQVDSRATEQKRITRSGHKLQFLLEKFTIDVQNKICVDLGCGSGGWTQTLLQKGAKKVYAIDKTKLDKGLQKNKKVVYLSKKAEDAPKIKEKIDLIVMDVNVGPEHAKKIFLQFDKRNSGAKEAIITQKIMRGKDLKTLPTPGTKWGKWNVKEIGNTWWARKECYLFLLNR